MSDDIKEIGTRIYYEKNTGNVITWRGDMWGWVIDSTFDQDYENYIELQKYPKDKIGMINLEYGEYDRKMKENRANSFRIDISSGKPEVIFEYLDESGKVTEGPEPPKTLEEKVDEGLKDIDNLKIDSTKAIAELCEAVEADRIKNATAIAEIYEMILNGGE